MNEITKLAFIDELEKIGFVDSELLKEAFLGQAMKAVGKAGGKLLGRGGAAGAAKAPMNPAAMKAMKARWAAGAPRAGAGATLRRAAPSAGMNPATGGGIGRGMMAA